MSGILIIGDYIVDHYIEGVTERQSPEDHNVSILDIKREYYKPGGAGNLAIGIRNITDYPLAVLSIFPELEEINRDVSIYWIGDSIPVDCCIVKTRIINMKTKKQILRLDLNKRFFPQDIDYAYDYISSTNDFRRYDYVVVSDYCKGIIGPRVIDTLNKYDGQVFVDTKNPDLSIWDNIKNCIIKVNRYEWEKSNKKTKHPIIVTRGPFGADLKRDGVLEYFPTNNKYVTNANVIGAGDNFLAGFVVEYIKTKDFAESIRYANKIASDAVAKPIGE